MVSVVISSAGCLYRHTALNDIIHRSPDHFQQPIQTTPTGSDGPDGIAMVAMGKEWTTFWDATCVDTYAHLAQSTAAA